MTRLVLNPTPDGEKHVEVITEDNHKHGEITDVSGVANFNIGDMDIDTLPDIAGIVLWTEPNSSHPTPDAWDTNAGEFIGPISAIPVGSGTFGDVGGDILPVDPRYHQDRGADTEVSEQ